MLKQRRVDFLTFCGHFFDYRSNREVLQWQDVDIFTPPKLRNSTEEAFRLNELLSQAQYECQKSITVGRGNSAFKLCAESISGADVIRYNLRML